VSQTRAGRHSISLAIHRPDRSVPVRREIVERDSKGSMPPETPISPNQTRVHSHSERQKTQTNHAESISHLVHQASRSYDIEAACISPGWPSTLSCAQSWPTRTSKNRPRMACGYHCKSREFDLFDCTTAHLHFACFSFVPREPVWHAV
jgi:hypothetical protein